jgi:hypothetical protein
MKMTVFWVVASFSLVDVYRCFRDASVVRAMMEATRTSKTLVNFYQTTRRNNPEDSHLYSVLLNFGSSILHSYEVEFIAVEPDLNEVRCICLR